jgi:hypothetical protein
MTAGLSILAAGGHVIIPSPYSLRLPRVIQNYWRIVERFQATIVSGVPTSIAALAEVPIGNSNVASVRMALTGGAVLPKTVGERFEKRTGTRLFETYGMTETAAAIAFNPGRGEPLAGSVGFRAPYAKTLIAAFSSEDKNPKACAPLTSGLVLVQGPQVFPGYVDPQHNVGVLTEAGWLVTGDIGYLTEDERLILTGPRTLSSAADTISIPQRSKTLRTILPACKSVQPSACPISMRERCQFFSWCPRRDKTSICAASKFIWTATSWNHRRSPGASSSWKGCRSRRSAKSSSRHCGTRHQGEGQTGNRAHTRPRSERRHRCR